MKKIDADQLLKRLEMLGTLFQLMFGIAFMYLGLSQDENFMAKMCMVSLFIILVIAKHLINAWEKEWFPNHDDEMIEEALGGNGKKVTIIAAVLMMVIVIAAIAILFFKFHISLILMLGIVIVAITMLQVFLEILIGILERFIG